MHLDYDNRGNGVSRVNIHMIDVITLIEILKGAQEKTMCCKVLNFGMFNFNQRAFGCKLLKRYKAIGRGGGLGQAAKAGSAVGNNC